MRDEDWYLASDTGDIYVYVKPDDKILPKWEQVDVLSQPQEEETRDVREAGLGIIPSGKIESDTASGLRLVLGILAEEGKVEILAERHSLPNTPANGSETWYREVSTDNTYRLVEDHESREYLWEKVSRNFAAELAQ